MLPILEINGVIEKDPVDNVEYPKIDESRGVTPVMTDSQALAVLKQPDRSTVQGARDSAILCFHLYMGSHLTSASTMGIVDYYEDNGFYVLNFEKKGGKRQIEAVNPILQAALNDYLSMSDHVNDWTVPLFIPVRRDKFHGGALSRKQFSRVWARWVHLR